MFPRNRHADAEFVFRCRCRIGQRCDQRAVVALKTYALPLSMAPLSSTAAPTRPCSPKPATLLPKDRHLPDSDWTRLRPKRRSQHRIRMPWPVPLPTVLSFIAPTTTVFPEIATLIRRRRHRPELGWPTSHEAPVVRIKTRTRYRCHATSIVSPPPTTTMFPETATLLPNLSPTSESD